MSKRSTLTPVIVFALTVALFIGLGILVSQNKANQQNRHGVRNIDIGMTQRDLPTSNQTTDSEMPQTTQASTESEAESNAEESAAPEKPKIDPVAEAKKNERGELWVVAQSTSGRAVLNANIKTAFDQSLEGGEKPPVYTTSTSSDGRIRIQEMLKGTYTVEATHPAYKKSVVKKAFVPEGLNNTPSLVIMEPKLTINGTVRNSAGNPVADGRATMSFISLSIDHETGEAMRSEAFILTAQLDGKGKFLIKGVEPGTYSFRVSSQGYATYREDIVIENESIKNKEVVIYPATILGGLIRQSSGNPLADATIEVVPEEKSKERWTAKSNVNGAFLLSDIPDERKYRLIGKAKGFANSEPQIVEAGRQNIVITMEAGGGITGTVTDFNTEKPKSEISVSLYESANPEIEVQRAFSDALGSYQFTNHRAGQYDVKILHDSLTSAPRLGVRIEQDKLTKKIDFAVYPGKRIRGVVMDGITGDRITNAKVNLASQVGPQFLTNQKDEVLTDAFGNFHFTNLPFGNYRLEASAKDYLKVPGEESTAELLLVPGPTDPPVELFLYRGGSITGAVTDINGAGVANAQIQIFNAPGRTYTMNGNALKKFDTVSASNGGFEITGLPLDNRLDLIVSAYVSGRGKGKSETVLLTEFLPTATTSVLIGHSFPLQVIVEDQMGYRLEEANVSISHREFPGDRNPSEWSKNTGSGGEVLFDDISEGSISVRASKSGYFADAENVQIPLKSTEPITLILEKSSTISGRVLDDGNVPFQEGWVQARAERGGKGGGRANIDSKGFFTIEGIGEGTFWLEAEGRRPTSTGKHIARQHLYAVESASQDANINIAMRGRIDGTVLDAETARPLPKATINLRGKYQVAGGNERTFSSNFTTSNIPGKFDFDSIPPGEYSLSFSAPGYLPETVDDFQIVSPGWHSAGQILLKKGSQITGVVVSEENGQKINRAKVTLQPSGRSAYTNSKGQFTISALEPDFYTVTIEHDLYLSKEIHIVQVSNQRTTDLGEINLESGGTLNIFVEDGAGKPVSRAKATIRQSGNESVKVARTNSGGRARLRGLESGGYNVTVSGYFQNGTLTQTKEITVSGGNKTDVDFTLRGDNKLSGRVTPPLGKSMSAAAVYLYPMEADSRPVVGGKINAKMSGFVFEVDSIPQGNYLVCCRGNIDGIMINWTSVIQITKPVSSMTTGPPSGTATGRVFSQNQVFDIAPITGATVLIRALTVPQTHVNELSEWWIFSRTTDGLGSYTFSYLPAGIYEIIVTKPGSDDPYVDIFEISSNVDTTQIDVVIEE